MKGRWEKGLSVLLCAGLLAGGFPTAFAAETTAIEEAPPLNAQTVWSMENLPGDLFTAGWATDANGSYDITRNEGAFNALQIAKQLGTIEEFTLFMNSPPSTNDHQR